MQFQRVLIAAALCSAMGSAKAAQLVQFQAGQPARAAEVNANFKALNDELAAVKSFSDLTEAQILALKNAVGVGGALDGLTVDCTNAPAALANEITSKGKHNQFMRIKIKGDCYASQVPQFHGFTLAIDGDIEAGARLIPDAEQKWALLGGFNGGLFLSNLTLLPPQNADGVMFSRSSQGTLNKITIEGGSNGVIVQANAQVYIQDLKIRTTQNTGIFVASGGQVRFFGNGDNSALVDTNSGTGLRIEQASASLAVTEIKAPTALVIEHNGTAAFQKLTLQGYSKIATGGQFSTFDLTATGDFYLQQGNLSAAKAVIVGHARIYEGSNYSVAEGSITASDTLSSDYNKNMVLDVSSGSQATLGRGSNAKVLDVAGHVNVVNGKISTHWTDFNSDLHMSAGHLLLNQSNFTSLGRVPNNPYDVNINSNSTLKLNQSNIDIGNRLLAMQSVITIDGDGVNSGNTGATYFQINDSSSLRAGNCFGTSYFNIGSSSSLTMFDCKNGDSVATAGFGSTVSFHRTIIGLVHVDAGSTAQFYQATLTGNGTTEWGDSNYNIGINSMMSLDQSSLTQTKNFNNVGTLRLQNNTVDMKGSTVECFGNSGHIQWWSTSAVSTIGALSGCNVPPAP